MCEFCGIAYNRMLAQLTEIYETDRSLFSQELSQLAHSQVVGGNTLCGLVWDGDKWAVKMITIQRRAFRASHDIYKKNLDRMIEETGMALNRWERGKSKQKGGAVAGK